MGVASRAVVLQFLGESGQLKTTLKGVQKDLEATSGAVGTLAGVGSKLSTLGAAMTRYVSLPLALAAGYAVKLALDYDSSMNKVAALTTVSSGQMKEWYQQVLNLGKTVSIGPDELAQGLYYVASSGFRGKAAMDILTASAQAATAGLGNTGDIARTLDAVMNAYHGSAMTAAQATDYMIAAVAQGDMPATDLANSVGQVLSIASQANVPFKDLAAAIAASSKEGINASKTAQGLRFMLSRFISPTAAATKVLKEHGWTVKSLNDELGSKGLLATLSDLQGKLGTTDFAKVVGGARGLSVALALVGKNKDQVAGVFAGVNAGPGSLARAYKTAELNPKVQLQTNLNALKVAGITLGNDLLPTVVKVAQWLAKVADKFSSLSPGVQQFIAKFMVVLIVLGPVLKIFGTLFKLLSWGLKIFGVVADAVGAVAGFLGDLWIAITPVVEVISEFVAGIGLAITPIGWIILAVIALTTAFILAWKYSGTFRKLVSEALSYVGNIALSIGKHFSGLGNAIKRGFMVDVHAVQAVWKGIVGAVTGAVHDVGAVILSIGHFFEDAWATVGPTVTKVAKIIGEILIIPLIIAIVILVKMWNAFYKVLSTLIPPAFRAIRSAWDFAYNAIHAGVTFLWNLFVAAFNAIKSVVTSVLNAIRAAWSVAWNAIKTVIDTIWTPLHAAIEASLTALGKAWSKFTGALNSAWNAIWGPIETAWNIFYGWISKQFSTFAAGVSKVWNGVSNTISGAWNTVWSAITRIWGNIKTFLGQVWANVVQPILSTLGKDIASVGSSLWDGLKDGFRNALNAIIGAWDGFVKLLHVPSVHTPFGSFGGWDPAGDLKIPTIPKNYANGGIFDKATIGRFGEAGKEVIVPMTRQARAIELMRTSGAGAMWDAAKSRISGNSSQGGKSVHIENVNITQTGQTIGDVGHELAWALRSRIA